VADVLRDIVRNGQDIARAEVRLFKAEMREEASEFVLSTAWLAAGAMAAVCALNLCVWAGVYGLAGVMPLWASALTVGVLLGVAAAVLLAIGRTRIRDVQPVPKRTIESLQEHVEWATGSDT
jgi:hypothetical protein